MNLIIFWLKAFHILPVYRVDVLKRAQKYRLFGLCYALSRAADDFNIYFPSDFRITFPLFTVENARQFGGEAHGYWWPEGEWNTGRLDFLNWLIEQYKDDKIDLRS